MVPGAIIYFNRHKFAIVVVSQAIYIYLLNSIITMQSLEIVRFPVSFQIRQVKQFDVVKCNVGPHQQAVNF